MSVRQSHRRLRQASRETVAEIQAVRQDQWERHRRVLWTLFEDPLHTRPLHHEDAILWDDDPEPWDDEQDIIDAVIRDMTQSERDKVQFTLPLAA